MRRYRVGAHTKTDLKVHLVWIPKYRKRVLTGHVAIRARDVLRQIAMEHELEIISGKGSERSYPHVYRLPSDSEYQQDYAMVERHKLANSSFRNLPIFVKCFGAGISGLAVI